MISNHHKKFEKLKEILSQKGRIAIAFSGGVDSTFLLMVAHQVLGDQVLAITARTILFPEREIDEALSFTTKHNITHKICGIDELSIQGFTDNPHNRCYICKKSLFGRFLQIAADNGFSYLAEGSNKDDEGDYRPGLLAIKELDILSPLREAGLTKPEIRELSREMGLPTWEKPSFACLASRIPYGETITPDKLKAIEYSEQVLFDLGFKQVRVRHHGNLARIEVAPGEMEKLMTGDMRQIINARIKKAGFNYVAVDLQGYRTGSMNETIKK